MQEGLTLPPFLVNGEVELGGWNIGELGRVKTACVAYRQKINL